MNLVLFLTDGFGIRNFVLGQFLEMASVDHQVHVLHNAPPAAVEHYREHTSDRVTWHPIEAVPESGLRFFLRHSLNYAHMRRVQTQAMLHQMQRHGRGWDRYSVAHRGAKLGSRYFVHHMGIDWLNRLHLRQFRALPAFQQYKALFQEIRPDLIFFSSQWMPMVVPAVLVAQQLHIPTATFIFSWDNLTSKGYIIAPFDYYLVWSELMKSELLRFYPQINADQVFIVGTPQFDTYADDSLLWPRDEFCQRFGLDPHRPILCYAGGHQSTHPDEHKYLEILAQLVRDGSIQQDVQLIFRPAPTDNLARFTGVLEQYPEIRYLQPEWIYPEPLTSAYPAPTRGDMQLLANLIQHTAVNVNIASTMTIDFALRDKPSVNPAFDVSDPLPHGKPIWDFYYRFEHYRPVIELQAAQFPHSPAAMAHDIHAYLADSTLDQDGRRKIVELEIGHPTGSGGKNLLAALSRMIDS